MYKAVAFVAHPDDCILYAYPLIDRLDSFEWEIIYLTYDKKSKRGTEVEKFWIDRHNVKTFFLGLKDDPVDLQTNTCLFNIDSTYDSIKNIVRSADLILTHSESGDYGHPHHVFVNRVVAKLGMQCIEFAHHSKVFNIELPEFDPGLDLSTLPVHQFAINHFLSKYDLYKKPKYKVSCGPLHDVILGKTSAVPNNMDLAVVQLKDYFVQKNTAMISWYIRCLLARVDTFRCPNFFRLLFDVFRLEGNHLHAFDICKYTNTELGYVNFYDAGVSFYNLGMFDIALLNFKKEIRRHGYREALLYYVFSCFVKLKKFDELVGVIERVDVHLLSKRILKLFRFLPFLYLNKICWPRLNNSLMREDFESVEYLMHRSAMSLEPQLFLNNINLSEDLLSTESVTQQLTLNLLAAKLNVIDDYNLDVFYPESKAYNVFAYWDIDPPSEIIDNAHSYRFQNYRLYNDEMACEFIRSNLGDKYLAAYNTCVHPAMKSDYFRLCKLFVDGGLYVDADEYLVNSPDKLINFLAYANADSCLVLNTTNKKSMYLQNNIIYSLPRGHFVSKALDVATDFLISHRDRSHTSIWHRTGPGLCTRVYLMLLNNNCDNIFVVRDCFVKDFFAEGRCTYKQNPLLNWRNAN